MGADDRSILIVEDSMTYVAVLKRMIAQRLPNPIGVAKSLAEARSYVEANRNKIFVALLDLGLPDAPDGEIVDYMVSQGITSVAITGKFREDIRQQVLAKNVVAYITKENVRSIDDVVRVIHHLERNEQIKVLIASDLAPYRDFLSKLLRPQKFQVIEASSTLSALSAFGEHSDTKVVVIGHNAPALNGLELVSSIRKSRSRQQLGIIAIGSPDDASLSAQFLNRGANDFVYPSFSRDELLCRIEQNVEVLELVERVKQTANRDNLTRVFNRRYFFEVGGRYYSNLLRKNLTLAVCVFDICDLKGINDKYGDEAGDVTIKQVANVLQSNLRNTDVVARFGETFCVLAVNVDFDNACKLFNRIRESIAAQPVRFEQESFRTTVSAGCDHA